MVKKHTIIISSSLKQRMRAIKGHLQELHSERIITNEYVIHYLLSRYEAEINGRGQNTTADSGKDADKGK